MIRQSSRRTEAATYCRRIDAGDYWLHRVEAGQVLRIVDVQGNQAADTLFYAADDIAERYSAVDTVAQQGNVYLSTGSTLLSSRQRPMLEIVADLCGRHDTLGGACAAESNSVRYGHDRKCMHSCRDSWMLAIAQHEGLGLSKRDITHNINFFMNVPLSPEGGLTFADGMSDAGCYVEMLAHMAVLVLISNCPQLNNPCSGYDPSPLDVVLWNE